MNAAPTESQPSATTELRRDGAWPRHRWVLFILLAFTVHIGLIFALSDRKPVAPRAPAPAAALRLLAGGDEWLALSDPTLFALPHLRGFAGAGWLKLPRVEFPAFEWNEPPHWLPLPVEQLGGTFLRFMQTNTFAQLVLESRSAPTLTQPEAPRDEFLPAQQSTVRVEGELAARRWLNPRQLPPWQGAELPANTVVQVLVDATGYVRSAIMLPPSSGSKTNDEQALALARAAHFAPLANGAAKLSLGSLVFQWRGEPSLTTNLPSASVQP